MPKEVLCKRKEDRLCASWRRYSMTSKSNFLNMTLKFSWIEKSTQGYGDECRQKVWQGTLRRIWLNHNACLGVYSATHAVPVIYHVHNRRVAVNKERRWKDNWQRGTVKYFEKKHVPVSLGSKHIARVTYQNISCNIAYLDCDYLSLYDLNIGMGLILLYSLFPYATTAFNIACDILLHV